MAGKRDQKQRNLGRGLAVLMGDMELSEPLYKDIKPLTLGVDLLEPAPFQPRVNVDEQQLAELAESIKISGVLQPILVRPHSRRVGFYQIIAGERRWRASQIAGLHEIPVIICHLSDKEAFTAALVENLQRSDLNAIEEAEGLHRLGLEFNLTQEQISDIVGKSRSHVTNLLRLLTLPDGVRSFVEQGLLSAGHARALLSHSDPIFAARHVIDRNMSVRQTEEWIKQEEHRSDSLSMRVEGNPSDVNTVALEKALQDSLGLKVKIHFNGKKGSVRIYYQSLDQFDSLLTKLKT